MQDCCKTKNNDGCCKDLNKSNVLASDKRLLEKDKNLDGGKKMNSRTGMWVIIGALFVAAMFLTFQAGAVGSGGAVASGVASTGAPYGGMVGGC